MPNTVSLQDLEQFCRHALLAAKADTRTADAATRAMMHATTLGVDSHGVRLLPHYITALEGGRLNRTPKPGWVRESGAIAVLDADNAHGALGGYLAMTRAVELARTYGIGAVAIRNNSHFGPAGAYSIEAAKQGFIGITFCNSDSFVRLHQGAARFHGTNPVSVAVPVPDQNPWLLDMATSSIPYNRVQLARSLGNPLPAATASDFQGSDTQDAEAADMLAPLGGEFGFKGAGLAGVAEIFSAVLSGMKLSFDILPMGGPDLATPRGMGAFVMALQPDAFLDRTEFNSAMSRYVHELRGSAAKAGSVVLAPGDREWQVAENRHRHGVALDPVTAEKFSELAEKYGLENIF